MIRGTSTELSLFDGMRDLASFSTLFSSPIKIALVLGPISGYMSCRTARARFPRVKSLSNLRDASRDDDIDQIALRLLPVLFPSVLSLRFLGQFAPYFGAGCWKHIFCMFSTVFL